MSNVTIAPSVGAATLAGTAAGNWPSTALLFITEFASLFVDSKSGSVYPRCPAVADQLIPFGALSVVSAAFTPNTRVVRLHSTGTCSVNVGNAPVAGGTCRLAASTTEFYAVAPGDALAVIASA